MKTEQEIQDKIIELTTQINKKNKKSIEFQLYSLNWVLDGDNAYFVYETSTEELQKDGINIEFG